jgi:hypothetical protein
VDAGLDVRLVVEGGVGALDVEAGRNITVTGVADLATSPLASGQASNTSALKLVQAVSTGGNVTLIAKDGLEATDPATTLIQGNRVELSAGGANADIGGSGALRINSNILGSGGFAAKAGDDINITETSGDLKLIRASGFATNASVEGGGDVTLRTVSGSILDSTIELKQLLNNNPITVQQQKMIDQLNGLVPVDFAQDGTPIFDADPLNDISSDSFRYPVSPGLYSFLYPQAAFPTGLPPVQKSNETLNVTGQHVTLIADGGGSIGRSQAPSVVNLSGGFAALSTSDKILLSSANASDVYGTQYATYRYVGPNGADGSNLADQNFGNTSLWQKITYFATGAGKPATLSQTVANNGYVLVEFNNGSYGLYQYKGTGGTLNLAAENYANTVRWNKVTADRSTDDSGTGNLTQGMIVLDKTHLERVALQLRDDVNLQAGGQSLVAVSDGNIAIASPTDLSIDTVRAGGDVLLKVAGSIADTYADTFAAIGAFGDLSISANDLLRGGTGHTDDPLRIALSPLSKLYVDAGGSIDIDQVSGNMTIDGVTKAISDLYVAKVGTAGSADIEVMSGEMTVERIDAGTGANLVADTGSIIDAFDDAGGPIVNVASGDLYLEAGSDIGSAGNFFDVLVSGDFSGLSEEDAFINTPAMLNITTFTSNNGDVTMTVGDTTNVGLIKAHKGTVTVESQDNIVDRYDDTAADIEANSVDLVSAGGAIGSSGNWFDIDSSFTSNGTVNALAQSSVFLIETAGAMRIDEVHSQTTNVWLKALDGSLLDANGVLDNNVTGINVNLEALKGNIGEPANALEIDSSHPSKGVLNAHATGSLNVTETAGTLYIGTVTADTGSIILSVRDSAASGEDFIMETGATISAPATERGNGDVLIQAGDNVHLMMGSSIASGRHTVIHSGYGDTGNVDAVGTTITVEGMLSSNEIEIAGERQNDTITLRPVSLLGHVRVLGGHRWPGWGRRHHHRRPPAEHDRAARPSRRGFGDSAGARHGRSRRTRRHGRRDHQHEKRPDRLYHQCLGYGPAQ